MAGASIAITGVAEINAKLGQLASKEANAIVRKAMREAMKAMQAAVKLEEPEAETHELKRLVKVRAGRRSRNSLSIIVGLDERDAEKWHGPFVEYGTSEQAANPAMRRAYDHNRDAVKQDAMARILQGIEAALA